MRAKLQLMSVVLMSLDQCGRVDLFAKLLLNSICVQSLLPPNASLLSYSCLGPV